MLPKTISTSVTTVPPTTILSFLRFSKSSSWMLPQGPINKLEEIVKTPNTNRVKNKISTGVSIELKISSPIS